jgi:hypothetical protein
MTDLALAHIFYRAYKVARFYQWLTFFIAIFAFFAITGPLQYLGFLFALVAISLAVLKPIFGLRLAHFARLCLYSGQDPLTICASPREERDLRRVLALHDSHRLQKNRRAAR